MAFKKPPTRQELDAAMTLSHERGRARFSVSAYKMMGEPDGVVVEYDDEGEFSVAISTGAEYQLAKDRTLVAFPFQHLPSGKYQFYERIERGGKTWWIYKHLLPQI